MPADDARSAASAPQILSDVQVRVLDFERDWTDRVGPKDAAILSEFGLSSARYYQVLSALIDSPVALRHDPLLVRRLQRVRDSRARARAARTFTSDSNAQDPTR